eukprot:CAMPEP_0204580208 /NCGR_PEP_ID=MMETSP0661-20131031/43933_1 /ASSEMBLY_ACC=CAM_ASM_000606 /TAXON_ID=109239 /ORGANISM="Alexandrium margalefi, Strain AMGDE01CS-322" /LENGTH=71 /DNA_ID=CAMNT_0051589279 /DNA_START=176 /DNA_END=391 /DNA_ORIENTATION=-
MGVLKQWGGATASGGEQHQAAPSSAKLRQAASSCTKMHHAQHGEVPRSANKHRETALHNVVPSGTKCHNVA